MDDLGVEFVDTYSSVFLPITGLGGLFSSSLSAGIVECLPRMEGTLLPSDALSFPLDAASSSHPFSPDAILGRCLPSRRRSVRLIDPYLPPPLERAGGSVCEADATDEDRSDGTLLEVEAEAEGEVTIERREDREYK